MRKVIFLFVLVFLFNSCSKKDNDKIISNSNELFVSEELIDENKIFIDEFFNIFGTLIEHSQQFTVILKYKCTYLL